MASMDVPIKIELTGERAEKIVEAIQAMREATASTKLPFIKIFPFHDAPDALRNLSGNGGDEDWIAIVPPQIIEKHGEPIFLDEGTTFGCCAVERHELMDGTLVLIGCHA